MVVLLLTSCEKFLDVNVDPNNPTVVSPDLVLPTACKYTGEILSQRRRISHLGNMLMQNWSQSDGFAWYPDEFRYNVNSSFYQNNFNTSYSNALKQYQILAQLEDTEYDYYKAIGKIMKAYHFQLLVDMYGDIPYSEALLRKENATPVYDDAATIYGSLIGELTAAIDLIKNVGVVVTPGADDAIFGGNMTNWIRFANTVKLRILNRVKGVMDVQAEVSAIFAEGTGFITDDVGVNPGYLVEEGKQNPMWDGLGADPSGTLTLSNNATCATQFVLDYLDNTADPRIDYIYEKPATGHLGVVQGLLDYDTPTPDQFMPEFVSNIGPGILKSATMDVTIFTLAESYFNQAEASLTLSGFGATKDLYESGIQASFDFLGCPGASAYYSQPERLIGWDFSSTVQLETIITQKWIAVNGITAEQSWFDYSRTGFPSNLPVSLQATTSDRPVRLFYPAGELSSNGANVPTQPDAFSAKIFWAN